MEGETMEIGFLRHIQACNNAVLPGDRLPFRIGAAQVGWLKPEFAARLTAFPEITSGAHGVTLADGAALPAISRQLSDAGCYRWRREEFDIRAEPDGPVLARLDRGALPTFGVLAMGVHVNGLVHRRDGLHIWIARRAANKHLDPSKLDHIVAGGVPAGLTPTKTLVKEAEEEPPFPRGSPGAQRRWRGSATPWSGSRVSVVTCSTATTWIYQTIFCRKLQTARWRRSSFGRSTESFRRCATPTRSSSTSTWY